MSNILAHLSINRYHRVVIITYSNLDYGIMKSNIFSTIKDKIPAGRRVQLRQQLHRWYRPAFLGTLRRTTPLSDSWGFDRGTPVDRYYIEHFLNLNRADIHGKVLEIKDSSYTTRYGDRVSKIDILDIDKSNPEATIIADLARADTIAADSFDCFIFNQTLQLIYDFQSALSHAYRILRPGGVLLATVPGLCRVERAYVKSDYWRFTTASCLALFGDIFRPENVTVQAYGNVLTAITFLAGMASEELSQRELAINDEHFPILITIRAEKHKDVKE